MDLSIWTELAAGIGCRFDAPRPDDTEEWALIARLDASTLYLNRNQTYRGQSLLILDLRHACRPDELTLPEWNAFCADLHRAEIAVQRSVKPDHVNVVSLGNVMPHLHWHIIPRYRSDPRWGQPIWPEAPAQRLSAEEESALKASVRELL
jgi:diadenosine tetraphosphate (Ap4A) HIT family hydrolase